jgi:hypothetical protein
VSTASTLKTVGVAARILRQRVERSRTLSTITKAVVATARSFGHVLHQLWLEVIGAVFLAMAGFGGIKVAGEVVKYQAGRATAGRVAIAVCFTATFAWFGVTSFWRVRRKG